MGVQRPTRFSGHELTREKKEEADKEFGAVTSTLVTWLSVWVGMLLKVGGVMLCQLGSLLLVTRPWAA